MNFEELDEFKKDVKTLGKRFKTLPEDIEIVKKVLSVSPAPRPPFSYRFDNLGITTCVIKIRKIACRSLKGKGSSSGLRIVYAYFEEESRIVLIEIYYKGDKENADETRIKKYFT